MTMDETDNLFSDSGALDDDYEIQGANGSDELLNELVGEGKKYKTAADLAFSKLAADAHIKKIQEENKRLREAVQKQESVEALLKKFKDSDTQTAPITTNPTNTDGGGESGALNPDDLVGKVLNALEERTKKSKEQENMSLVKETVKTSLGPQWQTELKNRLAESGLDESSADILARRNPTAFFKLIGVSGTPAPKPGTVAPPSKVNGAGLPTGLGSGERTQSYYDNLKAKMGIREFASNKALQSQMHADALRLGERFFDK